MIRTFLALFMAASLFGPCVLPNRAGAEAAEFDVGAQRTVLRRLQYCLNCGSALLVTRVRPGVMVRCPDCGKEQPRLPDSQTLTQIYQLCRLCENPLDSRGRHPGDVVECDNCHTRQILSRDVFPSGESVSGLGYPPGFPPGSGKKTLLHSPERPDAVITPIPLDDGEVLARIPPARPATPIPRPPEPAAPPVAAAAPPRIPSPGQWTPSHPAAAAPEPPRLPPVVSEAIPDSTITSIREPEAVTDVPAVSVDLFGGRRPATPARPLASSDELLARVDGTPIFASDVERVAGTVLVRWREQAAAGGAPVTPERERELRREILERLIDRELAVREAASLGQRPDPAAVRRREAELAAVAAGSGIDIRREAERDVIMADMRRVFAEKPAAASPGAVRDFYRRHREELMRPRRIAMSQLVVYQNRTNRRDSRNHRAIAAEISGLLESGARFDDLRQKYDEFPAATGLPPPEPSLLPEEAYSEQILANAGHLRLGAVFGPVMLEGMAVFGKVVDERPEGPIPFEEVEKEIRDRLENETAERHFDEWLKRLRQRGVVELYLND